MALHLIDSHCHLDSGDFDADRETILQLCQQRGISTIIVPGVTAATWQRLLTLCGQYPALIPALGLHPIYLDQHHDSDITLLEQHMDDKSVIAVGEIGLDYYLDTLDRTHQQRLFEAQLCVARNIALPVILHVRKAHEQVLSTLQRIKPRGGIVHAFNGSYEQALRYIALGFKLGFGGMLTYARSTKLRELARRLPLDAIVLESDAPDMVVASHRGERNSPAYLIDSLASLAAIRATDPHTIAAQTTRNCCNVLGLAPRAPSC